MEQHREGRRLLVALLIVGVSSGLGAVPARQARAMALAAGVQNQAGEVRQALPVALAQTVQAQAGLRLLATSPLTWTQQAELTSTAQMDNDGFGWAVAVSGNTAVVGAPFTPSVPSYGAAYLFGRSGSTWAQQVELSDPGGIPFDEFGYAVAISGDTAVIGAPGATGGATSSGLVHVYVRSGGPWTLQATLAASDGAFNDAFGSSVAISGSTVVVGAPGKTNEEGAAYVFVRNGSTWTQQAALSYPGSGAGAEFGNAVALSADTAVIAAVHTPDAYVYGRSGSTWSLQATLADPGPSEGRFYGVAVGVSGDTALVSLTAGLFRVNGVVYVFTRRGTTWTPQAALSPPAGTLDSSFGYSLALSGATAVVGGGPTYVYVGRGSTWGEQAQLIAVDRPPDAIGYAVAVWQNTAVVGATGGMGAAYVFVRRRVDDQAPTDDSSAALRPVLLGHAR